MREKIVTMTRIIEERFGQRPVSHRAGRWAINESYARLLAGEGYLVDCSVTPKISWRDNPGAPSGTGGADYRRFPHQPYFMNLEEISQSGNSALMEIPVTVSMPRFYEPRLSEWARGGRIRRMIRRRLHYKPRWLRPNGRNLGHMLQILDRARRTVDGYVMFVLHSSEFMPGGSPTFPDSVSIERLYADLERLFRTAREDFKGATLAEYYQIAKARLRATEGGGPWPL